MAELSPLSALPLFAKSDRKRPSEPTLNSVPGGGSPPGAVPSIDESVAPVRESPPAAAVDADRAPKGVDWSLVRELRSQVARHMSDHAGDLSSPGDPDGRALGLGVIEDLVSAHADALLSESGESMSKASRVALAKAVHDSVFGFGRLQPLLDDETIENVELFGADGVVVEYSDGRLEESDPVAESDDALVEDLNFLAANASPGAAREFSTASPQLHMRLPDGSRLAASMAISPRPIVTIRRHRLKQVTLDDLVARDMLTPPAAQFLTAAVRAQKTIMIAGPQGGGKTTLLRALCAAIDPWENVGTIESELELHLHELPEQHRRIRAWESRPGTGEIGADGRRAGEVTLDELTESVWRHNLDRLVLGEVRGREAAALMKVMSGIQGAMWTVHAPEGRAAVERMVTLMMESGPHVTVEFARRQVVSHVDLIVQIGVRVVGDHDSGSRRRRRYVSEILAVEEGEADRPAFTDVFTSRGSSGSARPRHLPPPKLLADLSEVGGFRPDGMFVGPDGPMEASA